MRLALAPLALLFAGCSTAPSLEDQARLIEYEQCLQLEIARMQSVEDLFDRGAITQEEWSERTSLESVLEDCKKYRP